MRVYLVTLGCPKNVVDSEGMVALLAQAGHELVDSPRRADLLLVNTCGFIEAARKESLDVLRKLGRGKRRRQVLVAAGCLAQRWGDQLMLTIPAVDGLLGTRRWADINALVEELRPADGERPTHRALLGDAPAHAEGLALERTPAGPSAYLKIADGCSAPCAFCAIPLIKGPARSRPASEIVAEARHLVAAGARELILIAQDTTAYGRDLGLRDALPDLIEQILAGVPRFDTLSDRTLPGPVESKPRLDWLRLMYAYPQQITPRLIDVMATHRQVCHYLDLPLQHGHPDVLQRMCRPHDVKAVLGQIDRLRAAMPDIALRTSLIVGFPGETEAEFSELLDFVDRIAFDRVGAFIYSPEADTPAAGLPDQVPEEVKSERYERLMQRQQPISLARNQALLGRTVDMLVEGSGDGLSVGRTYRDAPEIDGLALVEGEVESGTLRPITIESVSEYDVWGVWQEDGGEGRLEAE